MINVFFELDRLKNSLQNKGLDSRAIDQIVRKASAEIQRALEEQSEAAMQLAIEAGVDKRSPDFINELTYNSISMKITTDSGNMDFSEPPFPMLPKLLKNAKPMKDGTGVYKVIPVGKQSTDRTKVSYDIYDAWKRINVERMEAAKAQHQRVAPSGSKTAFRTATSKQSAATQWVSPAKEKNFTQEVTTINNEMAGTVDNLVRDIIRDYEEMF